MGRLARAGWGLRKFTPEEWRKFQKLARMVKAHPQAEAEMRRFSEAVFLRGLLPVDAEYFPVTLWENGGGE
ncbi:hypothetical protein HS125_11165 [bacterium]|nr:hypothetical protein [bacterium]